MALSGVLHLRGDWTPYSYDRRKRFRVGKWRPQVDARDLNCRCLHQQRRSEVDGSNYLPGLRAQCAESSRSQRRCSWPFIPAHLVRFIPIMRTRRATSACALRDRRRVSRYRLHRRVVTLTVSEHMCEMSQRRKMPRGLSQW